MNTLFVWVYDNSNRRWPGFGNKMHCAQLTADDWLAHDTEKKMFDAVEKAGWKFRSITRMEHPLSFTSRN